MTRPTVLGGGAADNMPQPPPPKNVGRGLKKDIANRSQKKSPLKSPHTSLRAREFFLQDDMYIPYGQRSGCLNPPPHRGIIPPPVIGHGILAGKYLAKYRD